MKIYIHSGSSVNALSDLGQGSLPEVFPSVPEGMARYALEPDYKQYITDAGSRRRMSRAVKMGVAAAMHCLSMSGETADSIISATGLGCLQDTEKFLRTLYEHGEELLNPTPFIQSTFNTVAAQVAILSKNTHYNTTYVHRGISFEQAVLDACMLLREGNARQVLTGAYEEISDTSLEIMRRLGYWRKGAAAGEGAQFFLFSSEKKSDCLFRGQLIIHAPDGADYLSDRLRAFLAKQDCPLESIDFLLSGSGGIAPIAPYYQAVEALFPKEAILTYKRYTGDYPTVSSLALWIGLKLLERGSVPAGLAEGAVVSTTPKRILLYNYYMEENHSFFLLERDDL